MAVPSTAKINDYINLVSKFKSLANSPTVSSEQTRGAQNNIKRSPWIMTCTSWLAQRPPRAIVWAANPSEVTWNMPLRSTITKNLGGTVEHIWPNLNRSTFYDEFRLSINLQPGNMMPVRLSQGEWSPSGSHRNFLDLIELLDQPRLTTDSKGNIRANLMQINYLSNLFPKLTLTGAFDPRGITFTDSSQSPNAVQSWSVEFIVYDSNPRLSNNTGTSVQSALIQAIQDRLNNDPTLNQNIANPNWDKDSINSQTLYKNTQILLNNNITGGAQPSAIPTAQKTLWSRLGL